MITVIHVQTLPRNAPSAQMGILDTLTLIANPFVLCLTKKTQLFGFAITSLKILLTTLAVNKLSPDIRSLVFVLRVLKLIVKLAILQPTDVSLVCRDFI